MVALMLAKVCIPFCLYLDNLPNFFVGGSISAVGLAIGNIQRCGGGVLAKSTLHLSSFYYE